MNQTKTHILWKKYSLLSKAKKNKLLEEEIKKFQVAYFFTTPLCGLQNLTPKKIFIQMDETYRSF